MTSDQVAPEVVVAADRRRHLGARLRDQRTVLEEVLPPDAGEHSLLVEPRPVAVAARLRPPAGPPRDGPAPCSSGLLFFERDRLIEAPHRTGFSLRIASVVVTIAMFFFPRRVFDAAAPALTDVGGSYFAFVLIGIAAQEFLGQSIGTFGGSLLESETTGTLELMLLGRSRLVTPPLSSTLCGWTPRPASVRSRT